MYKFTAQNHGLLKIRKILFGKKNLNRRHIKLILERFLKKRFKHPSFCGHFDLYELHTQNVIFKKDYSHSEKQKAWLTSWQCDQTHRHTTIKTKY